MPLPPSAVLALALVNAAVPATKMPYRAAAGSLYDSGDYPRAVATVTGGGRLDSDRLRLIVNRILVFI